MPHCMLKQGKQTLLRKQNKGRASGLALHRSNPFSTLQPSDLSKTQASWYAILLLQILKWFCVSLKIKVTLFGVVWSSQLVNCWSSQLVFTVPTQVYHSRINKYDALTFSLLSPLIRNDWCILITCLFLLTSLPSGELFTCPCLSSYGIR